MIFSRVHNWEVAEPGCEFRTGWLSVTMLYGPPCIITASRLHKELGGPCHSGMELLALF